MLSRKIGIIGWWGGCNEGDNYIKCCFEKFFHNECEIKFIKTPFEPTLSMMREINALDFLILGGGGLFTKSPPYPFNIFDQWSSSLKIPFGVLGVGIQELNSRYNSAVRMLVKKSSFFVVRDEESLKLLKTFSRSIILAPDVTFLYPRRIDLDSKKDKIGVNLRVWNFNKEQTYDNDQWTHVINGLSATKKIIPLSFKKDLDDRVALMSIQGEQNARFDITQYKDINIMLGMRLHSLIFAVQNAIPIIGISYTPKIKRFFLALGMSEFCLDLNESALLNQKFHDIIQRNEEISGRLYQYTQMAQRKILGCMEYIRSVVTK